MSVKCFVSFSETDVDSVDLKTLIAELKKQSEEPVEITSQLDLGAGDSLIHFMKKATEESDSFIILLGPDYKRKAEKETPQLSRSGSAVEFDKIMERYSSESDSTSPDIIPLFWSGSKLDDVFPSRLRSTNLFALDFRNFRVEGRSTISSVTELPSDVRDEFLDSLKNVAKKLEDQKLLKDKETREHIAAVGRNLLFPRTRYNLQDLSLDEIMQWKIEESSIPTEQFIDELFVKTRLYSRCIRGQGSSLISGRKGSGKTTLVRSLEYHTRTVDRYPTIYISVRNWDMHSTIQTRSFRQAQGDFSYFAKEGNAFYFTWAVFTLLSMVGSLVDEVEIRGNSQYTRELILEELFGEATYREDFDIAHGDSLINTSGSQENYTQHFVNRYARYYILAVRMVKDFIQSVVDNAPDDEDRFNLYFERKTNLTNLISYWFGREIYSIKKIIYYTGYKSFFLCLDGFDTEIQKYRKDDFHEVFDIKSERIHREIKWLSALVEFVEHSEKGEISGYNQALQDLMNLVRFAIVLPYDRVGEIRSYQRDSMMGQRFQRLYWTEYELLTMLRKRLQVRYGISDDKISKRKEDDPEKRYVSCLKQLPVDLPKNSTIRMPNKNFEIDLFLDVLRHTLFRPRDILIHYSYILGYIESEMDNGRSVSYDVVPNIIAATTKKVVNLEFVGELQDYWTNIWEILRLFSGANQVIAYSELYDMISRTPFTFYDPSMELKEVPSKIKFLYDIGFLGYRLKVQGGEAARKKRFRFTFIDRDENTDFGTPNIKHNAVFAIHPMFVEYLDIVPNTEEPILRFEWESVRKRDRANVD